MTLERRTFLGSIAALMTTSGQCAFAAPAAADFERRLALVTEHETLSGLHALLVSQHGTMIFEHYQPGEDEDRTGNRPGIVAFAPDVMHDLRSVTKGVVGLLYGIALRDGKVPPPEAGLYAQFPEYADLAAEPGRDRLTIAHVLSMTLGLQWDELSIPYGDPRNSETAMDAAADRYRYILSRPIAGEPGKTWLYCGGATALLGRLIARGTGMSLLDYAKRNLFEPMGFGPAVWVQGRDGAPIAASGLRLLPRDMLKLGELVLAGGHWRGQQLVPEAWVGTITRPVVGIDRYRSYGYHWYMGDVTPSGGSQRHHWIGGIGWGGQRLLVLPDLALVVGISCGNYGKSLQEQSRVAGTIFAGVVLPLVA
ncbi:MAG: serine hydrolase [Rhizobiales bacterium]|nr:serine hydrolase [Hyphomicrobiales bacterium]